MRKSLLAVAVAVAPAFAFPGLAVAQDKKGASPHTFAGNLGLFSSYRFRGIDQTFGKPALQGGIDYGHSSGLYAGNWDSNVSSGAGFPDGNLEMDFYGGWKKSWGDWGLDAGAIYYYYPGTNTSPTAFVNPRSGRTHSGKVDNKEIYLGGSWKWFSLKYSHALDDYFSLPDTKGSHYWDLSGTYDLGNGWGIAGHVGGFKLKNWSTGTDLTKGNYTDWRIGVTKDISGWVLGLSYIDTNAKGSCNAANTGFYCFANSQNSAGQLGTRTKDAGRSTLVFSVTKTF